MSVWESVEDLREYLYRSAHAELLRERHLYAEGFDRPQLALWWIPEGHRPTIAESWPNRAT